MRSLLAAALSGNLTMLFFSLAGGVVSILIMRLAQKRLSVIKTSVLGGVSHNLMQLVCAALLTATPQVSYYVPVLVLTGTVCGFFVGVLCTLVSRRLRLPFAAASPE